MADIKVVANELSEKIIRKIDPSWTTLQKIRFVYLEMGKYLEKNTDFFLNDKLDDVKKSNTEMHDIYMNDKIEEVTRYDNKQYQIICKSAAIFLKTVYDKLGIVSSYVHTCGPETDLLHWFLVVQDENTQYFLTLAADLPYIKNGFPTEHFANRIEYLSVVSKKQQYDIPNDSRLRLNRRKDLLPNGDEIEYDELETTSLWPNQTDSPKEYRRKIEAMKALDESIGYGYLYDDFDTVFTKLYSDLYMKHYERNMEIYRMFRECFNIGDSSFVKTDDITKEQVENFKTELNFFVSTKIENLFGVTPNKKAAANFEKYFKPYFERIIPGINLSLDASEILEEYKKDIKGIKNPEYKEAIVMLKGVIYIESKLDEFIRYKELCESLEKKMYHIIRDKSINDEEAFKKMESISKFLEESYEMYNQAKQELSIVKINNILERISMYFLPEQLKQKCDTNEYVGIDYIIDKFTYLFPLIFDCDFNKKETSYVTNFSKQGYSEQVVIIKETLKKIFSELSLKNCQQLPTYDDSFNPIDNRIRILPYRDRQTGEYAIVFRFWANLEIDEDEKTFIYIPKENLLREFIPFSDNRRYLCVSNSMKNTIDDLENFEEPKKNSR